MAAMAAVVGMTTVNNYQKKQQFRVLNQLDEGVKVTRRSSLLKNLCGQSWRPWQLSSA